MKRNQKANGKGKGEPLANLRIDAENGSLIFAFCLLPFAF